jgi:hypothetical protein
MFVFDTSAYVNGWRYHYPPETFPGVWEFIEAAMDDGRVLSPRAVYNELGDKDDDVFAWAKPRRPCFIEPTEDVQKRSGEILAMLPKPGVRDGADPWVVAEGEFRELVVVTYEGTTFGGVPTRRWHRSMPGICQQVGVPCITLPVALGRLGASFRL